MKRFLRGLFGSLALPERSDNDDDPPALHTALDNLGAVKAEVTRQQEALRAAIDHNSRMGRLLEVISASPQPPQKQAQER